MNWKESKAIGCVTYDISNNELCNEHRNILINITYKIYTKYKVTKIGNVTTT